MHKQSAQEGKPIMSDLIARGLVWLFVIFLGITFGAGIYEERITVRRWLSSSEGSKRHWNADEARRDDVGRRFWAFVTTVPLTLLTLASLIVAWRSPDPLRGWWLAAAIFALGDRIFTFSYFIPTMLRLMRAADSPESVMKASQWANLNYVRLALALAAWLASLNAFSLLYRTKV
jgi:anthrone oxygenase-like protein